MTTTLKVYSGNGMSASFRELMPQFERAHHCKVEFKFEPAQVLLREIKAGNATNTDIYDVLSATVTQFFEQEDVEDDENGEEFVPAGTATSEDNVKSLVDAMHIQQQAA